MTGRPPDAIDDLARRRAEARRARDFAAADELRAQIEAAGWKVVDDGYKFHLQPAGPSATIASRLDEPATAAATVVCTAAEIDAGRLAPGTQVVAVGRPTVVGGRGLEVVEVSAAGLAETWNIGLRRSVGEVVILLGRGVTMAGDVVTPVRQALADQSVVVVGAEGLVSTDLRNWAGADRGEVDAVDATCMAFRRSDAAARGPLDERFASDRLLAAWWSLVLRDDGADRPARRALALDLPVVAGEVAPETDERRVRRDRYRIIDRFGRRYDLLARPIRPTAASATDRPARRPRRPASPPAAGD